MALRSDINVDDLVIDVNKKNSFKFSELNKIPIIIFVVVLVIALTGFLSFRTINAQNTAQAQEEFEAIRAEYKKKGVTYTFNDYETDVAAYRQATKKLVKENVKIPSLKDFLFSGSLSAGVSGISAGMSGISADIREQFSQHSQDYFNKVEEDSKNALAEENKKNYVNVDEKELTTSVQSQIKAYVNWIKDGLGWPENEYPHDIYHDWEYIEDIYKYAETGEKPNSDAASFYNDNGYDPDEVLNYVRACIYYQMQWHYSKQYTNQCDYLSEWLRIGHPDISKFETYSIEQYSGTKEYEGIKPNLQLNVTFNNKSYHILLTLQAEGGDNGHAEYKVSDIFI